MPDMEQSARHWGLACAAPDMHQTLKVIASFTVQDSRDPAQLAALCIAMAQIAVDKAEAA